MQNREYHALQLEGFDINTFAPDDMPVFILKFGTTVGEQIGKRYMTGWFDVDAYRDHYAATLIEDGLPPEQANDWKMWFDFGFSGFVAGELGHVKAAGSTLAYTAAA